MEPMYYALHTINNPAYENIWLDLGVFVLVTLETLRFLKWMRYLVNLLHQYKSKSIAGPSTVSMPTSQIGLPYASVFIEDR